MEGKENNEKMIYKNFKIFGLIRIRNEESIITDSLNHLSEFCTGGIFVYDDCSNDQTVDLAKSHRSVIKVIEGKYWDTNREQAEFKNRAVLLQEAKKMATPNDWFVYIDADERVDFNWLILQQLPDDVLAVRMKLFDFYITESDKDLTYHHRKWMGPEYREIIIAFRNLPSLAYKHFDQREIDLGINGNILNQGYVKHYGKALSIELWERKCDYYAVNFPKYSEKWRKRKGKAVHEKSDFNFDLILWEERISKGIKLTPEIENGSASEILPIEKQIFKKLNILLTNHHLKALGGSEIFTLTIAEKLNKLGHNVIVYSKYLGELVNKLSNVNVTFIDDLHKVKDYPFDIAHVHHNINALEVRYQFPKLPIVYISHGVLPFLEQPPFIDLKISKYIAISEEVKANLLNKIPHNTVEIFRNVIDLNKFNTKRKVSLIPKKALVISSRLDNIKESNIREACKRLNIEVKFVGNKYGVVEQDKLQLLIEDADIVFSLGRGAMEAMICGRVPIIYDYLGGDGMVTPDNFEEIMKNNFSGRRFAKQFSVNELIEIIKNYKPEFGEVLKEKAQKFFNADTQIQKLLEIYNESIKIKVDDLSKNDKKALYYLINIINETRNYTNDSLSGESLNQLINFKSKIDKLSNEINLLKSQISYNDQCGTIRNDEIADKRKLAIKDSSIKISIIIPTYNKLEFTKKCLAAINKNSGKINYEVIIVDNGSTDGTQEYIKRLTHSFKHLTLIENKENLGFAKANNIGGNLAAGQILVFLNNDTEALNGWLEQGIKRLESDTNIGIVGAKLLYADKTIQHCGIAFTNSHIKDIPIWPIHHLRGLSEDHPDVNIAKELFAVTGACLFIHKELFFQLEGFDEEYGMYFEDIDLCFKVSQAGKKIFYEPKCTLFHYEGQSSSSREEIDKMNIASSKIFYSKWYQRVNEISKNYIESNIFWIAPFFNPSGYASEAISFALGLDNHIDLTIRNQNLMISDEFIANMPERWKQILFKLHKVDPYRWRENFDVNKDTIIIHHQPGHSLIKFENIKFCIGRTMFETDRIPKNWIDKCNQMDEIWVPSKFNWETFSNSGVDKNKLIVIPESIDTDIFNPDIIEKMELPNKAEFNFLSVFEWTNRKGWDVLLKSYFKAFTKKDDVCLYLRTYLMSNYDSDTKAHIQNKIDSLIIKSGFVKKDLPRIELLTTQFPFKEMLRLYKSVDAFVLPSRGEGWGRPYMEAMAMGLPVIGTNWSGNTEFMTDENSFLIDIENLVEVKQNELESYIGHKWAQPSERHLIKLFREVYQNREEAKAKGTKARKDILGKI